MEMCVVETFTVYVLVYTRLGQPCGHLQRFEIQTLTKNRYCVTFAFNIPADGHVTGTKHVAVTCMYKLILITYVQLVLPLLYRFSDGYESLPFGVSLKTPFTFSLAYK